MIVRWMLGVTGTALLGFGVFRMVDEVPQADLIRVGVWLVAALVLHDGVVAPIVAGLGVATRALIPSRARPFVQGGLVVAAAVVVVAAPLVYRSHTPQPESKALLQQDYAGNAALLLGLVAAAVVALAAIRAVRTRRGARDAGR